MASIPFQDGLASSMLEASSHTILLPASSPQQLSRLLPLVVPLAHTYGDQLVLLHVQRPGMETTAPQALAWLEETAAALRGGGIQVVVEKRLGWHPARMIRELVRELEPALLVLSWSRIRDTDEGAMALNDLLLNVPCDLVVLRADEGASSPRHLLLPTAGGPNARLALTLALPLLSAYGGDLTVLGVVSVDADAAEIRVAETATRQSVVEALGADRAAAVTVKVVANRSPISGIIFEANGGAYDLVLIGASREGVLQRLLMGAVPEHVARHAHVPVLVVKRPPTPAVTAGRRAWDAVRRFAPNLTEAEKVEIASAIGQNASLNVDFVTMLSLSTVIAALGLLLNSPAVVIGAMVVAPLMSAIVAMGLGIVLGDKHLLTLGAGTTARGSILAVVLGILLGWIVPGASVTAEMAARGSPSLLDLGVALAAGAAGAYAFCRRHVSSSLAGVAIAVALVPPLATVGLALSMWNSTLAAGAGLLFLTNLVGIASASGLVFLLLGFLPHPGRQRHLKLFARAWSGLLVLLLAITLLLGFLTWRSVSSARMTADLDRSLAAEFAKMPGVMMRDYRLEPSSDNVMRITVEVQAERPIEHDEGAVLQASLASALRRPVALVLEVIPTTKLDPSALLPPTPEPAHTLSN